MKEQTIKMWWCFDGGYNLSLRKPERRSNWWYCGERVIMENNNLIDLLPHLTWEDEPIEIEITIKF